MRFTAGPLPVEAEEVAAFAARYDPQPFHLDDAAAKGTLFGGLAASGWHTAGMTMRLIVDSEFRPAWGVIGGGGGEGGWGPPRGAGGVAHVGGEVVGGGPPRGKPP